MEKKRRLKWAIAALLLLVAAGAATFAARGPYMSNYLKKLILGELHKATGRQVIAQRIYINFFPLFVGAEDIKISGEDGQRLAKADSAKAYVELSGLLRREIEIRRLYIGGAEVSADASAMGDVASNINKYAGKETRRRPFLKVRVRAVEIGESAFTYYDEDKGFVVSGNGVGALIKLGEPPQADFTVRELSSAYNDLPRFSGALDGSVSIEKDGVNLKRVRLRAYDSELGGSGFYSTASGNGEFTTEIRLLVESVRQFFGLKRSGEGRISANGKIDFNKADITDPSIDLSLRGNFYLETLMELLEADTDEPVAGLVTFRGKLGGRLSALKGSATARLQRGNLFGIAIDDLRCGVNYANGLMEFKDGKAKLWAGEGEAEVAIAIPDVEPYSVRAKVKGVDSNPLLELIGLRDIGLPAGKAEGELYTEGMEFNPSGWFSYESAEADPGLAGQDIAGQNVIGRITRIEGGFDIEEHIVTLSGIRANTDSSELVFSGSLNTLSNAVDMEAALKASDIKGITTPYFDRLSGSASVEAEIGGTTDAPEIYARIKASGLGLDGYRIGEAEARASFVNRVLEIEEADAEDAKEGLRTVHSLKGKVSFPVAEGRTAGLGGFSGFGDFGRPEYDISASVKNADLASFLKAFDMEMPLKGRFFADFDIKGSAPAISGTASVAAASAYGFPLELASFGFSYEGNELFLKDGVLKRGESVVNASGRVSTDGAFDFKAASDKLFLRDILSGFAPEMEAPVEYTINLNAEGKGTFDEPEIKLRAELLKGSIAGKPVGDGRISAELKGRALTLDARAFNGLLSLKGGAELRGDLPWSAEFGIARGRYDFLVRAFAKDFPPDALLLLEGSAKMSGTKETLNADAVISRLNIAFYEQEFSNDEAIRVNVSGRKVSFGKVLMRGGDASFSIAGGLDMGRSFDISVEGKTSLLPLAELSRRVDVLRGKGDFVLSVKGAWDSPSVNGGVEISEGTLGIRGFPQRLTNISGYIFVDESRITVERLSARSGGGELEASGTVHLKGLGIERINIEALVNQATIELRKDFTVNFSGNLILKGSPEALDLTGEVSINRARYRERVEWRTWLVTARRKEIVAAETLLDRVRLNLRIYGQEGIVIDNNIARASLKVDLVAKGTLARPVLYGRIEAEEGRVYFRNNEFRIVSATVDFSGTRTGPYYVILAETFSGGYRVWLTLEGFMERFDLTLRSDPPLDEVSILALLTVGEFGGGLSGLEGGIGAAEAASFLTGKYQDVIEERFRDITGLDRVQIDPYVSKSTGSVVPKVTVSKKLVSDKLYVTYSTAVGGSSEEQVLKLEYFLSGNLSLVGVRDERGSVGGDIKLRFKFK